MPTDNTPQERRDEIARIIDEAAFRAWREVYDYALSHGQADVASARVADHFHGQAITDALAKADQILALPAVPTSDEANGWRHVANEWADMATAGIQWLRNIRDGISTVDEALENMGECLAHCQQTARTRPGADHD